MWRIDRKLYCLLPETDNIFLKDPGLASSQRATSLEIAERTFLLKHRKNSDIWEFIHLISSLSGGCISNAYKITDYTAKTYFLKINSSIKDLFIKEAHGLSEIKKAKAIKVPEVILYKDDFQCFAANELKNGIAQLEKRIDILVTIDEKPPAPWRSLGRELSYR